MPFASTDGAPPSPATDPAAAQEVGQPMALSGLSSPMQLQASGPDLSGIFTLIQKLEEGLLTLAQAVPMIAPDIEHARVILMQAGGKFATQATGSGTSPSAPLVPGAPTGGPAAGAPTGQVVTQAGAQFPGAVGPKPF